MKHLFLFVSTLLVSFSAMAQKASVEWQFCDKDNLNAATITGDEAGLLSSTYLAGTYIAKAETMTGSNAVSGFTAVSYDPNFTQFYVTTKKTAKTAGHCISLGVTPKAGHTFKPTKISFDAAKCGTDGGNFDVCVKPSGGTETTVASAVAPLRNIINASNSTGFSHHEYSLGDQIVDGKMFVLMLYIYNINGVDVETPKSIAFRNIRIEGVIDEPIFTADHYLSALSCKTAQGETLNLLSLIKGLKNGASASYPTKLMGEPTDFQAQCIDGYTAEVTYADKVAKVNIKGSEGVVLSFDIRFVVSNRQPKPVAKPLSRGLIAVNLGSSGSSGNLVSWRYRQSDGNNVKFKLWRGTNATTQNTKVNSGNYIYSKTNFHDASGSTTSYYRLEVYDLEDNLLESVVSGKAWSNQSFYINLEGGAPTDPHGEGATYTPNDASFCDMDGDGEYEIILKWSPSNEKDAASNGTTSDVFFGCYKMDGTRLWLIDMGINFFASAHTIQFIAWDLDGDGYGEFMVKTAPGTIDGEGNYVLLGNDSPTENLLSSRGKQDHGSEYITVFDGTTGAELATIPYHTKYGDVSTSIWGDSNQNRSERYLAGMAYLDGPDKNPSAIFARGYYSGAFVGAYDWDGEELKMRWCSRNTTSGQGLWGEGAHWLTVGDVDGDNRHEIVYGSACLDHNGSLLYRTGLGHGDALHLSDFITDRPGQEVLMPHEKSPYGIDIRDAKTGKILLRQTESGDTGRGLAAHFDASQPSSQFLSSARAQMYNMADESLVANSWAIGSSGAGINCRIYWNGDPYDEFFDKSVLAHWNATGKGFDRIQFNGGNYLWGNLNNGSKNNPCVLGDLLGDWREEIVTWEGDATSGFRLIVNSTNFTTEYRLPHLMEDLAYRCQVVGQNVCYNQPPHLSYDPAHTYSVTKTIQASGYVPLYASYSLQIPAGVTVYMVNNATAATHTLKLTKLATTIPAGCAVIVKGTPGEKVTFRTADQNPTASTANKLRGDFYDLPIETTGTVSCYVWKEAEDFGSGFVKVDEATVPAGEVYLRLTGTLADEDYYVIDGTQPETGIEEAVMDDVEASDVYYTLDGKRIVRPTKHGVYIHNGTKVVR